MQGKKAGKYRRLNSTQKLETTIKAPNGARAKRCSALKRSGGQCGKPARQGFKVCGLHGAGFATRERAGLSKPAGRPPTTGRYAKQGSRTLDELFALKARRVARGEHWLGMGAVFGEAGNL
jgi:hypothetical protein